MTDAIDPRTYSPDGQPIFDYLEELEPGVKPGALAAQIGRAVAQLTIRNFELDHAIEVLAACIPYITNTERRLKAEVEVEAYRKRTGEPAHE